VSIRNNLNATVDISLRPGSVDRYTVVPEQVQIKPGELSNIEIKLKIIRYAHIKKATTQGQRDIFHIKVLRVNWCFSAETIAFVV